MTIEILYPLLTNIYGDLANVRYLKECLPKAKFIETNIEDKPYFVEHDVNLIYMGSMPNEYQEVIVSKLSKYKDVIKKKIEDNVLFLITGSALEIFGNFIEDNGNKIHTLGIFDNYFKRELFNRHNSLFIGDYNDIVMVGNKSQFTYMYGTNNHPFIKARYVCEGSNPDTKDEGICYKNFYGTYLLGPILILNPDFTKFLLKKMGAKDSLKYEDDLYNAYNRRVKMLERPEQRYILSDHG